MGRNRTEAAESHKEDLEIEGSVIIERAHRMGDVRKVIDNKRPQAIVEKLLNYKDKTLILQKAKEKRLSRKHVYINDDYSDITMRHRKDMEVNLKRIREAGDYAVIRYDKLITTPPKNGLTRKNNNTKYWQLT